jgi:hypothetical protein
MRLIKANESTTARRYVFFQLVDATDGITAETGEAGGQPQVSSNGGAWTNTGISTLTSIDNGRYYAELTQTLVATAGTYIETRYKSANTAECPGDSVHVVGFDPNNGTSLGLSNIDTNIGSRMATFSLPSNFNLLSINGTGQVVASSVIGDVTLANNNVNANTVSDTAAQEIANAVWTANITQTYSISSIPAANYANDTMGKRVLRSSSNTNATEAVVADAVWEEPRNDHNTGNTMGHSLDQIRKATYATVGTIDGTSTASVLNTDLTGYANNAFDQQSLVFISGALAGESGVILTYNTNGTITMDQPFTTAPTNVIPDEFVILPTHVYPLSVLEDSIADAILGRNIAGGSDGGRMVKDALRFLRNRFAVSAGLLTVYQEDDTTAAWTSAVTDTPGANPITESNPAGGAS